MEAISKTIRSGEFYARISSGPSSLEGGWIVSAHVYMDLALPITYVVRIIDPCGDAARSIRVEAEVNRCEDWARDTLRGLVEVANRVAETTRRNAQAERWSA